MLLQPELRALFDSLHLGITFQPGEHAVRVEVTLAADEPPDPDNRVRRSGPCSRGGVGPDLRKIVRLRRRLSLALTG